ncbi:hypothetical protein BX600DRAFT_509880 [Xylariales sp. PMI_506]|nr:hypothetical protein BX600DRAFT_509880 [Xylariales sp. PMI_506]
MPAPGDQHNSIANPFEEAKPRISGYTASEIATLQSRLEKQLGPEYLSARSGPSGQKVHYIAAEKCIALANEVFGFNGWSSSIQNIQVDFVDENPQTFKISLGLSVIVRVTLRDGTFHEDIGYGHIENCKGKAAAFEKAKKEGTTDALKRALRNFGNVLGNCIYDKEYLAKVTKMKVAPTKFAEENLHRHADFARKQPEIKTESKANSDKQVSAPQSLAYTVSTDLLDDDFGDFDMADFGVTEDGHPDEVLLPGQHEVANTANKTQMTPSGGSIDMSKPSNHTGLGQSKPMQPPPKGPMTRGGSNGPAPPRQQQPPHTPNHSGNRSASNSGQSNPHTTQFQPSRANQSASGLTSTSGTGAQHAAMHEKINTPPPATGTVEAPGPVTFFSARSVGSTDGAPPGTAQAAAKVFDPHADSPSIRKTPGIDHRSSKPVARNGQHVAPIKRDDDAPQRPGAGPPSSQHGPGRPATGNIVNPSLNVTRQIGAPGAHSPMGNRGQYRPLTVKRPAPGGADVGARTPLNEVTTNSNVGSAGAATDSKRQKTG